MIRLSETSKMPCKSWGLQAWSTCPGARKADGEAVDICKVCYALKGRYVLGSVVNSRFRNGNQFGDLGPAQWAAEMAAAIGKDPYFRWFDSGDISSIKMAEAILAVCKMTPATLHWIQTRSYKLPAVKKVLQRMARLPNVAVRCSSDAVGPRFVNQTNGERPLGRIGLVLKEGQPAPPGIFACPARSQGNRCGDCRACWDKAVKAVAYELH